MIWDSTLSNEDEECVGRKIMAKKNKDAGLQYIMELGFYRAKNMTDVMDQLTKAAGKETAEKLIRVIDFRADHKETRDDNSFYAQKNETSALSIALTGAFDADIIRQACNWIVANRENFGKTILEVGCDCGVMSCFLARQFPDVRIVSIDRCEAAIKNARELAEKMHINNVTFMAADLKNVKDTFETVFSMRTVHENIAKDDKAMRDFEIKDLPEQAEIYRNCLHDYCGELKKRMAEGGLLISIERINRDALLLGWMEALYDNGMAFDVNCYTEIKCKELRDESVFRAFIAFSVDENKASPQELFDYACSKYLNYSKAQYEGWDAKIVFENRKKDMIVGYLIDYPKLKAKVKTSIWTHKYDETSMIFYQNNNGNVTTTFHDISRKDELLMSIQGALTEARAHGGIVKKLED